MIDEYIFLRLCCLGFWICSTQVSSQVWSVNQIWLFFPVVDDVISPLVLNIDLFALAMVGVSDGSDVFLGTGSFAIGVGAITGISAGSVAICHGAISSGDPLL